MITLICIINVSNNPVQGEFNINLKESVYHLNDRRAVHTKLMAMVSTNPEAEALIKLNEKDADG